MEALGACMYIRMYAYQSLIYKIYKALLTTMSILYTVFTFLGIKKCIPIDRGVLHSKCLLSEGSKQLLLLFCVCGCVAMVCLFETPFCLGKD